MKDIIYDIVGKQLGGNPLSQAEEATLNDWLQEEGNPEELEQLKKTWEISAKATEELQPDLELEWNRFQQLREEVAKENPVRKLHIKKYAVAASIALILGVGWLFLQKNQQDTLYYAQVATQEITLPDNSTITLNKGSKISYPKGFGKQHRELALDGEAFFKVTKAEVPFIITTASGIRTQVLGTQFHLRSTPEQVELNVVEGLVAFGPINSEKPLNVSKDQKAIAQITSGELIKTRLSPNSYSWLTNKLTFDSAPMNEVHAALEQHFGMPVKLPADTSGLQFSGTFNDPSLEDMAEVIALSLNWNYIRKDNSLVFIEK